MSRIGLLVEGGIDEALLPSLLKETMSALGFRHPEAMDTYLFPYRSGGFGEIPKNLRILVRLFEDAEERQRLGCDLFVVIHDSRGTDGIQKEIRTILKDAPGFPAVYGLAIQEIEAWVLGDIENVNREVFRVQPLPKLERSPERDPDPKATLTEKFVIPSRHVNFDRWNPECARAVAPYLRPSQVSAHCPKGFGKFLESLKRNPVIKRR